MRPLLNEDFRRLRWLLRQQPPKRVLDYLVREVGSLAKGGIEPVILAALRNSLQRAEPKMADVISVLCFVSRMRLRDRGGVNMIPLTHRVAETLYKFFNSAAFCWPTAKRQAGMLFCRSDLETWSPGPRPAISDEFIERKIVEGIPDLCTHVRARVERLYAFFDLPPDLSLPPPPLVRSIWEMPISAESLRHA